MDQAATVMGPVNTVMKISLQALQFRFQLGDYHLLKTGSTAWGWCSFYRIDGIYDPTVGKVKFSLYLTKFHPMMTYLLLN
jgi:hypothetical protein